MRAFPNGGNWNYATAHIYLPARSQLYAVHESGDRTNLAQADRRLALERRGAVEVSETINTPNGLWETAVFRRTYVCAPML